MEALEERTFDKLVYDSAHPLTAVQVVLKSGQGILPRGTVIAQSSLGEGNVVLGTTAQAAVTGDNSKPAETLKAAWILCDSTDTGTNGTVVASCYETGHFNRTALTVKESYTMTAADEADLRNAGIYLSTAEE